MVQMLLRLLTLMISSIKDVKSIKVDLRNPEDCNDCCKNIDLVFMCVYSIAQSKDYWRKPLDHLTPNILMNLNMLESAYKNNVEKFLFISSNTVYPMTDHAVKEIWTLIMSF